MLLITSSSARERVAPSTKPQDILTCTAKIWLMWVITRHKQSIARYIYWSLNFIIGDIQRNNSENLDHMMHVWDDLFFLYTLSCLSGSGLLLNSYNRLDMKVATLNAISPHLISWITYTNFELMNWSKASKDTCYFSSLKDSYCSR